MEKYLVAYHTDVGTTKEVNQDSVFFEEAETDIGPVVLAAVCDGMGGLSEGEKASRHFVDALGKWFENSLASAICREGKAPTLARFRDEMDYLIRKENKEISAATKEASGTTVVALLLTSGVYYTVNVGDSRVYHLSDTLRQLTTDQTVVQQDLDAGRITEEEARNHPQRSVLLQCVGASDIIVPDYSEGPYQVGDSFLLCSDGFRHILSTGEIEETLRREAGTEESMKELLKEITDKSMAGGEKDNISALFIRVAQGGRF